MSGHIRAMIGPHDVRWYGIKYEDRHIVKWLPVDERSWDSTIRAWVTSRAATALLTADLEAAGYTVALVDVSQPPEPRDWHAEYARVFGHPCPHRKKAAAKAATADRLPLAA